MTRPTTAVALLAALSATADARPRRPDPDAGAPALAHYTTTLVDGELWERSELAPRDRSVVTVAALTAMGRAEALRPELARALDNGLSPLELSEVLTQVGFYAGWPVGRAAAAELDGVLRDLDRTIQASDAAPLALDADEEAARRARVDRIARLAPGLAHYTNEVLFGEVWRRPGLAARDRSLATVATLVATGQAEQMPFHLQRALDAGLQPGEASEVVAHLAFVCGWPRAFSAVGPLASVLQQGASAEEPEPAKLTVTPVAEAPSFAGPAENFTGEVRVESLFHANLAETNGGGMVHFSPGAHTAWHTHPRGQTLIVTAGTGWVQEEGGERFTIRTGDVVRIPPDVRHWHGASAAESMSHIAIAESVDGSSVTWMELVPDAVYRGDE